VTEQCWCGCVLWFVEGRPEDALVMEHCDKHDPERRGER
jgi:hypothetical protein